MSSTVTIRVLRRDKERLERLARKTGNKRLSEAFGFALSTAEREADKFHGNVNALIKARKSVRSVGGNVSENIDRALIDSLQSMYRMEHTRLKLKV